MCSRAVIVRKAEGVPHDPPATRPEPSFDAMSENGSVDLCHEPTNDENPCILHIFLAYTHAHSCMHGTHGKTIASDVFFRFPHSCIHVCFQPFIAFAHQMFFFVSPTRKATFSAPKVPPHGPCRRSHAERFPARAGRSSLTRRRLAFQSPWLRMSSTRRPRGELRILMWHFEQ